MARLNSEVRSYRFELMQQLMDEQRLDALAFTTSDWFEWASNHPVSELAWERPFLLVVPRNGDPFAFLSEHARLQVASEMKRGSLWTTSVTCYAESPGAARYGWTRPQWSTMVAEALCSAGLERARIGADVLTDPLAQAAALLPQVRVSKVAQALRSLRWIKHPQEIEIMRVAASLSDWAMNLYREELRPGRLLAEVDHLVSARLARESARRLPGHNYVISRLLTLSGAASACTHGDGAPTGKTLLNNTVALTTIATRLNGLAMELARTWLIGTPNRQILALFDCALAAQEAAIETAVAGQPVSGIHAAAQNIIERAGFAEHSRLRSGHGIGVVIHDYPEDLPFNTRALLERETYAIEPGIYLPEIGGFRFADTVAIGTGSPERLTQATKQRAVQTLRFL